MSTSNVIKNKDVIDSNSLVKSGRFNLHGTYQQKEDCFEINIDANAPSAGFSIPKGSSLATPVESFLNQETDTNLLALGIGLCCKDKVILGKRPENISVAANKFTISGGRISESPNETAMKELAEELVILATNGQEDRFVRFSKTLDNKIIQDHAIEQLPYSKQVLALSWIQGEVIPKAIKNTQDVKIKIGESVYNFHGIPCVIEEYNTIDILLPHELKLPEGWDVKEVFFLENKDLTSLVATADELKTMQPQDFTHWAWALVNNI